MSPKESAHGLTAEAFAILLARLGPDAERAGAAYEALRRALVEFFTWRGAETPEECADETLDRLARRLSDGAPVESIPRFTHGIARLVLLEYWRRPDARRAPVEQLEGTAQLAPDAPDDDALHECLDRCLGELPKDGRDLILEYYAAEGRTRIERRKRLAEALGLADAALRNRAQRLRDRLEGCLTACLGRDTKS
jgi:DNA-directed RNA polymerase specialized sigma24 family protein